MTNPWFRVYVGLVDDPKFIKLGPDLRSALLMMWCVASANNGRLPPLEDIAIKFRMAEPRTKKLLDELRHCGFIDDTETGSTPHNWKGRQFQSDVSTERVKRFRNAHRNVSATANETAPDTEADQIQKEPRAVALVGDWPSDAFDRFWADYPTKIAKKAAVRAFATAKRSGVKFETVMFGLSRYKADKPPHVEWCHPATWLNGGRWEDQPAASAPNGQRNSAHAGARRSGADDFFAGLAEVAADIDRDGTVAGPADADIPRGRFEIDGSRAT